MNITAILIAAAVIAVAGIIVGIGLGLFGEKFKAKRSLLSLAYLPEQQRRRLHLYVVKVPVTRLRLFTTTKVLMTVQRHL